MIRYEFENVESLAAKARQLNIPDVGVKIFPEGEKEGEDKVIVTAKILITAGSEKPGSEKISLIFLKPVAQQTIAIGTEPKELMLEAEAKKKEIIAAMQSVTSNWIKVFDGRIIIEG